MFALLAIIALAFESVFGYPHWLYRAIGHPVSWIGRLIAWCDQAWNVEELLFRHRCLNGIATVAVCLAATALASIALTFLAYRILPAPLNLLLLAFAASSLIAQRSLYAHVGAVSDALGHRDLESARIAVAKIVGRDPSSLDKAGVSRAAIESLAENLSDGVVAPVFWLVVAGLPGAALYKTINTADSMIGHRSRRHFAFGWAAARLDDLVNLPASRLTALWLTAAASMSSTATGRGAVKAVFRDARRHRSPNAGWPEAAMAGALGVMLAGPRVYDGKLVEDHWMGNGRADAGPEDIRRALKLYRTACTIQAAVVALLAAAALSI
ncbi:MAG: adenosylcobinamide-phosphate synthase CbiB [Hyphomicrobium sp.]